MIFGGRRPRIAMVTPWRPERSGVSDYSVRLSRELARTVDVDVITAAPVDAYTPPQEANVRLAGVSLPRRSRYQRVIYAMGNSRFHAHVFELLRGTPGVVVFHDVQLTGFFGSIAGDERPDDPAEAVVARIRAMYGERFSLEQLRADAPNWSAEQAAGMCMTREIRRAAEESVVHSRFALAMLEADRGGGDPYHPARILPFGVRGVARDVRVRGAAARAPVLVTLGAIDVVKGLEQVISAFALLCEEHPGARLVVAGYAADSEVERWLAYAAEHAPGTRIDIPGYLGPAAYGALLRQADAAVQLRRLSNGECSGAIGDCLSAGIPTLVSDIGWAAEIPDEAVSRVPLDASPRDIAAGLHALLTDAPRRVAMSAAAIEFAREHSFARVADAYVAALGLGKT